MDRKKLLEDLLQTSGAEGLREYEVQQEELLKDALSHFIDSLHYRYVLIAEKYFSTFLEVIRQKLGLSGVITGRNKVDVVLDMALKSGSFSSLASLIKSTSEYQIDGLHIDCLDWSERRHREDDVKLCSLDAKLRLFLDLFKQEGAWDLEELGERIERIEEIFFSLDACCQDFLSDRKRLRSVSKMNRASQLGYIINLVKGTAIEEIEKSGLFLDDYVEYFRMNHRCGWLRDYLERFYRENHGKIRKIKRRVRLVGWTSMVAGIAGVLYLQDFLKMVGNSGDISLGLLDPLADFYAEYGNVRFLHSFQDFFLGFFAILYPIYLVGMLPYPYMKRQETNINALYKGENILTEDYKIKLDREYER